jgi:hypothetical protein
VKPDSEEVIYTVNNSESERRLLKPPRIMNSGSIQSLRSDGIAAEREEVGGKDVAASSKAYRERPRISGV